MIINTYVMYSLLCFIKNASVVKGICSSKVHCCMAPFKIVLLTTLHKTCQNSNIIFMFLFIASTPSSTQSIHYLSYREYTCMHIKHTHTHTHTCTVKPYSVICFICLFVLWIMNWDVSLKILGDCLWTGAT